MIFTSAFSGTAATGGFLGATVIQAMRWGVARGTFSNEAGLGSSPIAHAAARTDEPVREGLVAMLEPFVDTLVICSLTAMAILSTGVWHERIEQRLPLGEVTFYQRPIEDERQAAQASARFEGVVRVVRGEMIGTVHFFHGRSTVEGPRIVRGGEGWSGVLHVHDGRVTGGVVETPDRGLVRAEGNDLDRLRFQGNLLASGPVLTAAAFERSIPGGQILVTIALILFAFSTAISWSYYGDRAVGFLLGLRAVMPYRILFVAVHLLGAVFTVRVVWAIADVANAAMALPNLICLWALAPLVALMRRRYLAGEPAVETDADEAAPTKATKDRPRRKRTGSGR